VAAWHNADNHNSDFSHCESLRHVVSLYGEAALEDLFVSKVATYMSLYLYG
jgi:hypothetical protein